MEFYPRRVAVGVVLEFTPAFYGVHDFPSSWLQREAGGSRRREGPNRELPGVTRHL